MTAGDKERIYTATSSGVSTETYTYDVEGRVSNYKMLLTSRTSYPLETSYLYDTANRLTEVRYPAQYGMSGNPRKTVNVTYDQTSRLNDLKVSGVTQMDQIAYNDYGQATSIRIGGGTANPLTEQYSFDANTGLMTNQKVKRGATSLMDLSYNYARGNSKGSLSGTTGNLTNVVNNLDRNKDRKFEYDTLGRLTKALGGVAAGGSGVANWTQTYTFDRYGNKLTTAKSGITANSAAIPLDGLASQTYAVATNRITNSGTEYDNAGNQTRGASPAGILQRFEFDEAGRIKVIKTDAGAAIETNTYATSRERIIKETSTDRTYYAWGGSSVLAEFTEAIASSTPSWAKSYIYAGSRLLSTITKNGASELTEYHHPDRLGTKAVSDTTANTFKEQATLPFGAMIDAETVASTNQKFTSYDRSGATGLDYAVNRTYNSGQSRFTQVDPIGMGDTSLGDPQSMNLFAYVRNNPVNLADPSGLNASDCSAEYSYSDCGGASGFWSILNNGPTGGGGGSSSFGGHIAYDKKTLGDLPPHLQQQVNRYLEYVSNAQAGYGFISNEAVSQRMARDFAILYGYGDDGDLWTFFELSVDSKGISSIDRLLEGFSKKAKPLLPYVNAASGVLLIAAIPIGVGVVTIAGVGNLTFRAAISISSRMSMAKAGSFIAAGLANPATRRLTEQLVKHQQKLQNYIRNPLASDNNAFLRNASPERFEKVFRGRVQNLVHQINNFHKQIKNRLP